MQSQASSAEPPRPTAEAVLKKYFDHLVPFLERIRSRTVSQMFDSLVAQEMPCTEVSLPTSNSKDRSRPGHVDKALVFQTDSLKYTFSTARFGLRIDLTDGGTHSIVRILDGSAPWMMIDSKGLRYIEMARSDGTATIWVERTTPNTEPGSSLEKEPVGEDIEVASPPQMRIRASRIGLEISRAEFTSFASYTDATQSAATDSGVTPTK